jgi:hypothetical protein
MWAISQNSLNSVEIKRPSKDNKLKPNLRLTMVDLLVQWVLLLRVLRTPINSRPCKRTDLQLLRRRMKIQLLLKPESPNLLAA